jgi:hypothetical protein
MITMPGPSEGKPIVTSMTRGLAGAARAAAAATASVARHAAWYARYRVDGSSRAQNARDQGRARERD